MDGRGGTVENITFKNVHTEKTVEPIKFEMKYNYRRKLKSDFDFMNADNSTTPRFKDLKVINFTSSGALRAGSFVGLDSSLIENLYLENINIEHALKKFHCENVKLDTCTSINVTPEWCS